MPPTQIAVAGFPQGGAMALFTALRYPEKLAGVLALSTYLPMAEAVQQELSDANRGLPIFMAHGEMDDVVPINFARNSRKRLTQMDYDVDWREYPMPHSVLPQEVDDIRAFLDRIFKVST